MNDWMYQYPSVVLTRSYVGDKDYGLSFYGEGNKLLYQLKNQMKFQRLGQLKMTRMFSDGTVIVASSVFGHDKIVIDVSKSTLALGVGVPYCVITLIDFPTVVPPMWNPGAILADDAVDVDYISTYFIIDISKCSSCDTIPVWAFSYEFTSPAGYEYYDNDPNDHLIYSLDGLGYGEAIETGYDESGQYALWKVYTEGVDMSRTGYGFIKVTISVVNRNTGETVCSEERVVKVDCCQKDVEDRQTIMWWAYCVAPNDVCPVPEGWASYNALNYFGLGDKYVPLSAFPQKSGSCIPYVWKNLGSIGTLTVSEDTLSATLEVAGEIACKDQVIVSLKDRCGTEDILSIESCCDATEGPDLGYTSLQMGCGGYQTLMTGAGCPPFSWSVSGGGTITPVEPGSGWAGYQAPDSNAGCTNNATVTVTDCCGRSSSIHIAINCYGDPVYAFQYCYWTFCEWILYDGGTKWGGYAYYTLIRYGCDGAILYYSSGTCGTWISCDVSDERCTECGYAYPGVCNAPSTTDCPDIGVCSKVCDQRTAELLAAGCCPINPLTGLPF